jgi:hypothetical protein
MWNPTSSPAVIQSSNQVASSVHDFHERLGIESDHQSSETRRWMDAATEARDRAIDTGAQGVGAARNLGAETLDRASSVTGKLSRGIAFGARRLRKNEEKQDEQS